MVVVSSLGPPEEGVRAKQDDTEVYLNDRSMGPGTLYISEARVSWVGVRERGFSLEYPHIAVHAISRDVSQFHQECLYLMIDCRLMEQEGTPTSSSAGSDMEDNEEESEGGMTEIRFIPADKSRLDALFQAMNECSALHPDSDQSEEEEEEEGEDEDEEGMYEDAEELPANNGGGDGGGEDDEAMDAE